MFFGKGKEETVGYFSIYFSDAENKLMNAKNLLEND